MKRTLLAGLLAIAALAPVRAAAADATADIRAQMQAAQTKISSMRIVISSPMGFSGTALIITHPRKMHMSIAGPLPIDMYLIDTTMYMHMGAVPWRKQTLPPDVALMDFAKSLSTSLHYAVLPDVTKDGVTYGAFSIDVDLPMPAGTKTVPPTSMTCSYDKATMLPHECANAFITETITGYNDPAIAVDLPPEALTAFDAGPLPLPAAPRVSPAPSPAATP